MPYCKITKKYSHCQYPRFRLHRKLFGFFTLEFVYTLFIVTGFVWIISMYLTMSVHWQQQASNQLIALGLARDCIERAWAGGCNDFATTIQRKEGIFTVELALKKYPMPYQLPRFGKKELFLNSLEAVVSWPDERRNIHAFFLQSYM